MPFPRQLMDMLAVAVDRSTEPLLMPWPMPGYLGGFVSFETASEWGEFFLRWSLRYGHPAAHVAGVAAAFIAYHSSPALFPELARTAKEALTFFLGLGDGSPALVGWGDLGFLALLTVLGVALARRQAPERLRRLHGILIAVQVLAITALSLGEATH